MDWTWYLFRFDGRINRALFWWGQVNILCVMLLTLLLIGVISWLVGSRGPFSLDADDIFKIVDPATYRWSDFDKLLPVKLAAIAPVLWMQLALSIKRLHDRGRSGWWMLPFFVLPGLYHQFEDRLPDSYWMLPLSLAAGVFYLWGFIEMGFLRGTAGDNQFGADPLAEEKVEQPGAPWDQQRELEIVPPSASPPGGMHVKRGS